MPLELLFSMRPVGGKCWKMRFSKQVGHSRKRSARGPTRFSRPQGRRDPPEKERPRERDYFDAGGLIALDRNDRRVLTLLARASERGHRITIPTTALAPAIRNPARQTRLCRLIRQ